MTQVRLISGMQQWVVLPFALPARGATCCNRPSPFAKDSEHFFKCAALRKISAFRRHQMVVWFIESFVHRHGGTAVNGPTHIGGDASKKHAHPHRGAVCRRRRAHPRDNTSKTPFAVSKKAAQDKHEKYEASSKKNGF